MKYINSFLQRIKNTGNDVWNLVKQKKEQKREQKKYIAVCVAATAVFMVGSKTAGYLLDIVKQRNSEYKKEVQETIVDIKSEESSIFPVFMVQGLLIGNFEIEEVEEEEEKEGEKEELVLFGKEEKNEISDFPAETPRETNNSQIVSISSGVLKESLKSEVIQEISIEGIGSGKRITARKNTDKTIVKADTKETSNENAGKTEVKTAEKESSKNTKAKKTKTTSAASASADKEKSSEQAKIAASKTSKRTDLEGGLKLVRNEKMKMDLTKEELEIMERIVEAEATDEDIYGRILVANVVLNRVLDDEFPNTVKKVVFQKGQFSPIRDGRYYSVKVTSLTKEAVKRALAGEDYSDGALFFFARKLTTAKKASWFDNSLDRLFRYGVHEFFKEK